MTSTEEKETAVVHIEGVLDAVKDREDTAAKIGNIDIITLLEAFSGMRIELQIRSIDGNETRIYE